jgi:cytochrome c peroxidase
MSHLTGSPPPPTPLRQGRGGLTWLELGGTMAMTLIAGCTCRAEPAPGVPTPYSPQLPANVAPIPNPTDNPMTVEGVRLGRLLFYDPLLSVNRQQSCASCHQQELGFTDGLPRSVGTHGDEVARNSMPLFNLAWNEAFMWDGRAPSLEAQIRIPLTHPKEMDRDVDLLTADLQAHPHYPALFDAAFPGETATTDNAIKALAQFVRSIVSFRAPIDQAGDSAPRSVAYYRGDAVFKTPMPIGDPDAVQDLCNFCHLDRYGLADPNASEVMGLFQIGELKNSGHLTPHDKGLGDITGKPEDAWLFKVPSMRNLALTGPFLHDGSAATIFDAIEHYNHLPDHPLLAEELKLRGAPANMNLTPAQIEDMVVFLDVFVDRELTRDPAYGDPFEQEGLDWAGWTRP